MKIGILTPSIYMDATHHGGRIFAPGDLARNLVSGLVSRGHTVQWFSAPEDPRGATISAGDADLLEKNLQVRVFQDISPEIKDKMSLYGTKMYYELDLVSRAYQAAKEGKVEVIHVFHSFGYFAHFFQELTGVPTVYTLHDPIPTDDMLERWLLDRFPTHKYISISDRQRGKFDAHFLTTVYNGIDTTIFPYNSSQGNSLIAVGRMIPDKGHDIAISVAKTIGIPLIIASWITDNVKKSEYYIKKIAPFIAGKNIVVNSLMQGQNLAEIYQRAKALIFPLQWEEPFGLVMIEAMCSGTPVVAYNRGSVSEVIQDGITGFIVDPDNEDRPKKGSWIIKKQGIDGLIEGVKRIGEINRATCRKHVEEHFTIDAMVTGYERAYRLAQETQ